MSERFKELRKTLRLTQAELGNVLGISGSAVSKIEKGENILTEQNIKLLEREFGVNEKWLRTGEGEMFSSLHSDADVATFFADVLKDDPESFRRRFVSMLAKLDARDWEELMRIARKMAEGEDV